MGVHVIKVPDVGEGIAEVELVSWSVSIGDTVKRNQILAEVMTDKANVEIPSPTDGVIAGLNGVVGGVMAVGSDLIEMTVEGQTGARPPVDDVHLTLSVVANDPVPESEIDLQASNGGAADTTSPVAADSGGDAVVAAVAEMVVESAHAATSTASPTATSTATSVGTTGPSAEARSRQSRPPRPEGQPPLATPAVRYRAREAGIDLRQVAASGPAGRITHADLDAFWDDDAPVISSSEPTVVPSGASASSQAVAPSDVETTPIIGIRRQIAKRMLASTQSIPHITYVDEVDMTALEELRSTLNEQGAASGHPRLTLLPFLITAIVDAVRRHPQVNAHVDDESETLSVHAGVHVGIATQTPNGLVVPVLRHAEQASLWELASRITTLAEAARTGKAAPADLSGSTITITSLGALGGLVTTPVINKPEVAIVGVNKMVTRPVFIDGVITARKMMNLSSSFDHRIIDGWDAASFVQRIRSLLEQPALLFIDEPTADPGPGFAVDEL